MVIAGGGAVVTGLGMVVKVGVACVIMGDLIIDVCRMIISHMTILLGHVTILLGHVTILIGHATKASVRGDWGLPVRGRATRGADRDRREAGTGGVVFVGGSSGVVEVREHFPAAVGRPICLSFDFSSLSFRPRLQRISCRERNNSRM